MRAEAEEGRERAKVGKYFQVRTLPGKTCSPNSDVSSDFPEVRKEKEQGWKRSICTFDDVF